jgi:diaminopimelate epimerase
MAQLHLNKFNGAGNSFLIVDLISPQYKKANALALKTSSRVQWAKRLCDIHWGIGADGFIVLEKNAKNRAKNTRKKIGSTEVESATITWDFYNADGSKAEMCGNAARCLGHYLASMQKTSAQKKSAKKSPKDFTRDITKQISVKKTDHDSTASFLIKTKAGSIKSHVLTLSKNKLEAEVEVTMTAINELELGLKTLKTSKSQSVDYDFVNSGVPHAVVHYPKLKNFFQSKFDTKKNYGEKIYSEMAEIVKKIRNEKRFLKKGTNVTFLTPIASKKIYSLTFERGVPSYTLACGTGAVAATTSFLNGSNGHAFVQVPGGNLQVLMQGMSPRLIGPSEHMAEFVVTV